MAEMYVDIPRNTLIYGVYWTGSRWNQANYISEATHLFECGEKPVAPGFASGTLYENGDTFTPKKIKAEVDIFFKPDDGLVYSATITPENDGDSFSGTWTGEGYIKVEAEKNGLYEKFAGIKLGDNFDLTFSGGSIEKDYTFRTLILTLLFTDGRADETQSPGDQRGWIGDPEGNDFRSLLWLYIEQGRIRDEELAEIELAAAEALSYLTENSVCDNVEVKAEKENDEKSS